MALDSNNGIQPASYVPPPLAKPNSGVQIPCPRCDSTNTKFCYYNNYNMSQPRHFCKSCRRYWTHGGALRNVPVGGGTRKSSSSKRQRSAPIAATPSAASPPSSSALTTLEHGASFGGMGSCELDAEGLIAGADVNAMFMGGREFGYGLGHYDSGGGVVGDGRGGHIWPCSSSLGGNGFMEHGSNAAGTGMHNTWQFLSDLGMGGSSAGGVGDGFTWPGLAISSPWNASSK